MNNEFDLKSYMPILNPWFSTELVYEGWGKASFENPVGVVEGKTKVEINELGDLKIEMEYEVLETDVEIQDTSISFRILKFLYQNYGKLEQSTISMGDKNKNPCTQLTIQTNDGIFTGKGNIFWMPFDFDEKIIFRITRSYFEATSHEEAKYWVAPLTNFISTFPFNLHPLLVQHPLRLYVTSAVPEMDNEKQKQITLFTANERNHLIGFNFGEQAGYIEPLPDYSERKHKLKSGRERQCVTALMVGEITNNIDLVWFPYDYANLLSFASGTEVGVSWLEFRDKEGKLVRRRHFPSPKTIYSKEYAAIDEIHEGLGSLISLASNSPEFDKTYFRVLINQLMPLCSQNHSEIRMTILSRALEGLFEYLRETHGIGQKNLMANLPDPYKQEIKSILKEARNKIEKMSTLAKKDGLSEETKYSLERMRKNIDNVNNKDGDFGMKVLELLKWYKMPDAVIMEKYYSENVGKSWASFLSQMRNAPIHDGYFAIQDGTYDSNEIANTQDHLHDILVRFALKILEYEREYQPKVIDSLVDGKTRNWVNENTSAIDLGHERKRWSR